MSGELEQAVLDYLASHHVMTLCTVGDGRPWGSAVFYVNRGFDLYFLSEGKTRHAQNLAQAPRLALTIQEDYRDWREIKGLQMEGTAEIVTFLPERGRALAAYLRKYPSVTRAANRAFLAGLLRRAHLYRVRPERIYWLDNERGFSHRRELRP